MVRSRILIVEDEQIVAHELKQSLEAFGYEVSIAEDAETALVHASKTIPHLVLLDIVLPGTLDGIAAAEQFQTLNIPVVYMTGYPDLRLFERARRTEPFGYLTKPLQEHDVNRVVQLALFKHESEMRREEEHRKGTCSSPRIRGTLPASG